MRASATGYAMNVFLHLGTDIATEADLGITVGGQPLLASAGPEPP
jgi:hypothetical protein